MIEYIPFLGFVFIDDPVNKVTLSWLSTDDIPYHPFCRCWTEEVETLWKNSPT